jgi:hypothetical protein
MQAALLTSMFASFGEDELQLNSFVLNIVLSYIDVPYFLKQVEFGREM